jgi:hypothetical protein
MAKFFRQLAQSLPGAADGFFKGVKLKQDLAQAEEDRKMGRLKLLLAQQESGLRGREIDLKDKQIGLQEGEAAQKTFTSPVKKNAAGAFEFDPDYLDPNSTKYKTIMQGATFERAKHPTTKQPISRGDFYKLSGKTLPEGMDPNAPLPDAATLKLLPDFKEPGPTPQQLTDYQNSVGFDPTGLKPYQLAQGVATAGARKALNDRVAKAVSVKSDFMAILLLPGMRALGLQKESVNLQKDNAASAKLKDFSASYMKTGLPNMLTPFKEIEKRTGLLSGQQINLNNLPNPSAMKIAGAVPLVGGLASRIAGITPDQMATMQAIQQLQNVDLKQASGASVTKFEQARNDLAKMISIGAKKEDFAKGVRNLFLSAREVDRVIRAGAKQGTLDAFHSNDGPRSLDEEILGIQTAQAAPKGRGDLYKKSSAAPAGGLTPQEEAEMLELQKKLGKKNGKK